MHKKFSKAIAGSLMSAAMLATSVTSVLAPMSASAGQMLGQTDFEDGTGLPWHTCETNPAKQKFEIKDGKYVVEIVNVPDPSEGAGRWDLQFRHRGLQFVSGHTYKIHAEVTVDQTGYIYSKIAPISGSPELWNDSGNGQWQPVLVQAGQTLTIDTQFTASENVEVGEWAFHYSNAAGTSGGNEYGHTDTGMPVGSHISFDNLSLIDTQDGEWDADPTAEYGVARPQTNVRLNQVGYYSKLAKKATYITDASSPLDWELRDSSGNAVLKGKTDPQPLDPDTGTTKTETLTIAGEQRTKYKDSGSYGHIIDFSEYQPGDDKAEEEYTIFVKDTTGVSGTQSGLEENAYDAKVNGDKVEWTNWKTGVTYTMNESHPFKINNYVYSGLVTNAINYYYQNRSGVPIEEKYITSGDTKTLAHSKYGHSPDTGYVQSAWKKSYPSANDTDQTYSFDGTGGWYDAGDHGKYVVNGGISVWTLQNMYEISKINGTDAKWTDKETVKIPENDDATKGKYPSALNEARVELEWFFKMIVQSNDPYYGKDAGMVYHKLHDYKWTGLGVYAWDYGKDFADCLDKGGRIVKPPTYAATLNMVACAAQAARLWEGIDDDFAKECLKNAEAGYNAVINSGDGWKVAKGECKTDDNPGGDIYFAAMDQAIGGGAYGDTYVYDDMYWAACELYLTTGDAKYKEMLESYSNPNDSTGTDKAYSLTYNLGGGENKGSFSSFNWGCTSGLGTLSLYLNKDKLDAANAKKVSDSITAVADKFIDQQGKSSVGIPYVGATFTDPVNIGDEEVTGYEWGSNSFVINNAIVMSYAYDATGDVKYINGAAEAMDYIFGRNGNDFSYVSGYGDVALQYPHHRLWCHGVDKNFPMAPAGVLSGGPGAGMQDPYIGGL
ncbi:MAG: glycoside hydrolase family 9 protein, partial [Ruminococcus sp.]|nr:glycoside hydrolase family 9 protein [Ruminococcus sp.]